MSNVGDNSAYFIYGTFCFSMFIFTWFLIPETKGISLEKMDELFGEVPRKEVDLERNSTNEPERVNSEKGEMTVTQVEKN